MMALVLRCILYPGSHLFVTTGGKEQAASITVSKVEEICKLLPFLNNEINWNRGVSKKSKDNVSYIFKNGSSIDILAARESSRGQRRTGGLMEECVLIDGDALNEIIIPTTNVDRLLSDGSRHEEELVNKSQIYITTAGYKNTFAYEKLIELLINAVINPEEYAILGGTYQTPVKEGLLSKNFVRELKLSGTFNEAAFAREYCSVWSGDTENAYFSSEVFDKHRKLLQPEYEHSGRTSKTGYYILGIDVGRFGCTTEIMVIKVTPQPQGAAIKSVVNIYSYEAEHFGEQSIKIKKLFYQYQCRSMIVDGNGLGAGLVDFLVVPQVDPATGEELPGFGIENDEEGKYKQFKTPDCEKDVVYIIKATAPINTEMYAYTQTQMSSGKIMFLIDEKEASIKLMSTKIGQALTPEQRAEKLQPFVQTSILKDQLLNLVQKNDGLNIILNQENTKIKKDKASALFYGLYYVKMIEDKRRKKKNYSLADMMFFGR